MNVNTRTSLVMRGANLKQPCPLCLTEQGRISDYRELNNTLMLWEPQIHSRHMFVGIDVALHVHMTRWPRRRIVFLELGARSMYLPWSALAANMLRK